MYHSTNVFMDSIDKQVILDLANHRSGPCISIYIPTHRKGGEVNEGYDKILFKNQVQKLRLQFGQSQIRSNEIDSLLHPLEELVNDQKFWLHQAEGLAVFRSPEVFEYFHSPVPFEEQCVTNTLFSLRPLLLFTQPLKEYHILRITQKGCSLFAADPYSIRQIDTEGVFPEGLDQVTRYYDLELESQGQRQTPTGRGDGESTVYRGDGGDNKVKDHLLGDYFRLIDAGIKELLGQDKKPIVLACVEYYHPIYQGINTYPFLWKTGLNGSFEVTDMQNMHRMANELMGDYFKEMQDKRISQYQNSSGNEEMISHDLRQILESAVTGRIDALFVRNNAQAWGHFDENNLTATIHDQPKEGDESLIDKAALLTLRNGGEVYLLDDVNLLPVPDDDRAGIAALYRFGMAQQQH